MPRPSASGRSPFEVSSAIAVVITRVTPSMLPPTIITAPTSALARPRPASTAVRSEKRMSQSTVSAAARTPSTPSERSCSSYSRQASSTAWRQSAAMIGRMRIVCAITIALRREEQPELAQRPGARQQQVHDQADHDRRQAHQRVQQHDDRAAARESAPTASAAPSGSPSSVASSTAVRLTARLSATMPTSAGRPRRSARPRRKSHHPLSFELQRHAGADYSGRRWCD